MKNFRLDKRISIVTIDTVQNKNGFDEKIEIEYCKSQAKVTNMTGYEVYKAGADYSRKVTKFTVRYRRDKNFDTTMKIRFNDILYSIIYVNNHNESNEFVEIVAEVINNG